MNIQLSYLNFKTFHPHVQNNGRNCVQHTHPTHKRVEYNGLLTHFTCGVNTIIRVCLQVRVYGYYTMGTGPACQEVAGTGPRPWVHPVQGTAIYGCCKSAKLSSFEPYSCNWKTWLLVCPSRRLKAFVESF